MKEVKKQRGEVCFSFLDKNISLQLVTLNVFARISVLDNHQCTDRNRFHSGPRSSKFRYLPTVDLEPRVI